VFYLWRDNKRAGTKFIIIKWLHFIIYKVIITIITMIKKIVKKQNGYKARFLNGTYRTFRSVIDIVNYVSGATNNEKRAVKKLLGDSKPYTYKDLEAYM